MKKLLITYHMRNAYESAETCVTLPMADDVADDVLKHGNSSECLDMMRCGELYRALKSLSALQGYEYEDFCCAEEWKGAL